MEDHQISQSMQAIQSETDLNAKALLLAGLVSELFREKGFEPVVVGGSAIEFHTDGAYMSGDTDICWAGVRSPTPNERGEVMSRIPGIQSHGIRSWKLGSLWIDLLRDLSSYGNRPFSAIQTPSGQVVLLSVEELLAECIFAARKRAGGNATSEECARKLLAVIQQGGLSCDWEEVRRIASLTAYDFLVKLESMKREVSMVTSTNA